MFVSVERAAGLEAIGRSGFGAVAVEFGAPCRGERREVGAACRTIELAEQFAGFQIKNIIG